MDDRSRVSRVSDKTAARVAIVTGAIFVIAGLPKFVAFRWEVANFTGFGLPTPEAWVVAAGLIEIGGGTLLIARRWVTASSLVLAMTMAVAIGVSGIRCGDVFPSLTLAPALLVACIYLAVRARAARSRRDPGRVTP